MPRRSRFEIYANILEKVSEGTSKPTRIMNATNLSWFSLQRYLHMLVKRGFLEEKKIKKRKIYTIREPGLKFLQYFDLVKNELDIDFTHP